MAKGSLVEWMASLGDLAEPRRSFGDPRRLLADQARPLGRPAGPPASRMWGRSSRGSARVSLLELLAALAADGSYSLSSVIRPGHQAFNAVDHEGCNGTRRARSRRVAKGSGCAA